MTVPASVIWGVTFRVRVASLKVTETVLLALVWMGIWTPCLISAAWLFWVVILGVERMRPAALVLEGGEGGVEVEAAQDVAHRDARARC